MCQVSGGHGRIDPVKAVDVMVQYAAAGFTTSDMADHYGNAEDFYGQFHTTYKGRNRENLLGLTKWVLLPGPMNLATVECAIDVSRRRMRTDCLDMLQFRWWDYSDPRYMDALQAMQTLQQRGKLRVISLTNFDTRRLKEITAAGIPIASNQVSYSLVDRRPQNAMAPFCQQAGIKLLTYGTLLGGFLSDKWLGKPEPARRDLTTVSQMKYKRFIDEWGGWDALQRLLSEVALVARKHDVSVANVAVRWVLQQPAVGGVIVGARLGITQHIEDTRRVFGFQLDADDMARLAAASARGRMLAEDCGDEYRRYA